MGILSSLGKLVGNTLYQATGGAASAKQQFQYQKQLQEQQNQYNVYNMQHQYQWTMQDMQKAGLNPVLAASNGSNSVGAVGAGSASGGAAQGDILGGITSALQLALQNKQTDSNVELQKSQAELNNAKKAESLETTKNITPQASAAVKKLNSEAAVNSAETTKKASEIENVKMDTALKNQQRWKTRQEYQTEQYNTRYRAKEDKYFHLNNSAKSVGNIINAVKR